MHVDQSTRKNQTAIATPPNNIHPPLCASIDAAVTIRTHARRLYIRATNSNADPNLHKPHNHDTDRAPQTDRARHAARASKGRAIGRRRGRNRLTTMSHASAAAIQRVQ